MYQLDIDQISMEISECTGRTFNVVKAEINSLVGMGYSIEEAITIYKDYGINSELLKGVMSAISNPRPMKKPSFWRSIANIVKRILNRKE